MDRFRSRRRRKISLLSGIFINLGILFFYKYYEFAGSLITDFFSLPKYRNLIHTSMETGAIAGGNFVLYISSCSVMRLMCTEER